jgi:hypothetical protein
MTSGEGQFNQPVGSEEFGALADVSGRMRLGIAHVGG